MATEVKEVRIAELAQKERASAESQAQDILGRLKDAGGVAQPQTPINEILASPEHEVQTPSGIQITVKPQIVSEEKGSQGSVDDSATWLQIFRQFQASKTR